MSAIKQPSSQRASRPTGPLGRAWRLLMLLTLAFGSLQCGKTEKAEEPVIPEPTAKAATSAADSSQLEQEMLAALRPASADSDEAAEPKTDFERMAQDIMLQYPEFNAQELLNVPEVNPKLVSALQGLSKAPQLQNDVNSTVNLAAQFSGYSGPSGGVELKLDLSVYDSNRTERMLAAVLTGEAGPLVNFLTSELGEASFEFSFTDAEKTSNGVSFQPKAEPPSVNPPDTDPD
jgi:hypothetical protein